MARIICIGGRYYDTMTKNTSFLQLAKDLKTIGVQKWYFMLEIKDPSLITIDPYAEDDDGHTLLTKDQIDRVTIECLNNPWYYLREIARIAAAGAPRGIPYLANKGNIGQAYCALNGIDSWLCLVRQKGKTKSALALQNWAFSFGTNNSTFIFVNKESDNSKTNLADFKAQISYLPEYLRYEYIINEDGKIEKGNNSATLLSHSVTKNRIKIRGKATSYEAALSMARGLSAPVLHFDEVEFCPWIDVIVSNSVSVFEQSAKVSKEAGTFFARIFTSTPGDIDTPAGKSAEILLSKTVKWQERFYDLHPDKVNEILLGGAGNFDDEHIGVAYLEYSYREIGLTELWFKQTAAKIGNKLIVRREILLQRLRGSSASPYDADDIEAIIDMARKPIRSITIGEFFTLDIYEELRRDRIYMVGVDCSTGSGNDNNAIEIVDPYSEHVVAELESPYIGEPTLIRIIKEIVMNHIPKAILCIERNHVGSAIIKFLLESPIAGRIYFDKHKEIAEENMKEMETVESILKAKSKIMTYYGVWTENKSREAMFSLLADRIKGYKDCFVGQNVTRDISKLISKNGKVQAMAGWHDDSVMAYNICMYVLKYGNNLETFGFERGDVITTMLQPGGGLLQPDTIDLNTVPETVQEFVEVERDRHKAKGYEDVLRKAISASQRETRELSRRGVLWDTVYTNTVDDGYSEFEDMGDEVLDFLRGINE